MTSCGTVMASTSGNAQKKLFAIPSIKEIESYESNKPQVQSFFKSHKKPDQSKALSNSGSSQFKQTKPSSHESTSLSISSNLPQNQFKQKVASTTQFQKKQQFQPHVVSSEAGSFSSNDEGSVPQRIFQTSAVLSKAKSSFASKFASLNDDMDDEEDSDVISDKGITSRFQETAKSVSGSVAPKSNINSILVNPRQRGNPILKSIRNIPWEFSDINPDYVIGRTACALFLSLRYHHLNPNYIHDRLRGLGPNYELRVLLVQVDVKDPHYSLKELARICILADCTLILAFSPEEAGRYLETYKSYENKPVDALKEQVEQDHLSRVTNCLTTIKSVNRTDCITLLSTFKTMDKVVAASKEEFDLLPGFGPQKAQRLHDAFHEPFKKT